MEKILPLKLLFILIFAVASFAQMQKPPKGVSVSYDKFQDETEISTLYIYTGVKTSKSIFATAGRIRRFGSSINSSARL